MVRSGSVFGSVPPPIFTIGGACGRVAIAAAASDCSNVSVFSDGIRNESRPLFRRSNCSVETPRQSRPLL